MSEHKALTTADGISADNQNSLTAWSVVLSFRRLYLLEKLAFTSTENAFRAVVHERAAAFGNVHLPPKTSPAIAKVFRSGKETEVLLLSQEAKRAADAERDPSGLCS